LNVLAEAPVLVVHQPDEVLGAMDKWNTSTHARSGLIDKVKASTLDEAAVEEELLPSRPVCAREYFADVRQFDLSGSRFLARLMPRLEAYFHYRNLDVSTVKERRGAGNRKCERPRQAKASTRPSPTSMSRSTS
jgi:oligoribonuclease